MPLYTYECDCGTEFERVLPVARCDYPQHCPECGLYAKKVIRLGWGGIQRRGDGQDWVREAALCLASDDDKRPNIESVDDLRNFYRTHPNIRPKESHPALPSSYGDPLDRPNEKEMKRQRSRKAHEKLRELRSINVSSRPA